MIAGQVPARLKRWNRGLRLREAGLRLLQVELRRLASLEARAGQIGGLLLDGHILAHEGESLFESPQLDVIRGDLREENDERITVASVAASRLASADSMFGAGVPRNRAPRRR